jgi:D-alanine-D-alanine ligase
MRPKSGKTVPRIAVLYTCVNAALAEVHEDLRASMDLALNASAIAGALTSAGFDAHPLLFGREPGALCDALRAFAPAAVFNLAEGPLDCPQKEPHGAALLELLQLPYTGNGPSALSLCNDKALVKALLAQAGIATPRYRLYSATSRGKSGLRFPVIVKPAREDGSAGITDASVVDSEAGLRRQVARVIAEFRQEALAEEFVGGREFNVAVLGNGTGADPYRALPPGELVYDEPAWRVCCFASKWDPTHPAYDAIRSVVPAKIPAGLRRTLQTTALACARLFGLRGYARVDFRSDSEGRPHVLEVNPNPDISSDAGMARAAGAAGLSYSAMIAEILRLGIGLGAR